MRKATVAALTTNAAVAHGVDLAGQVSATAAEMLRARRDPAVVARTKRRVAQRRVRAWSAGAIGSGAATAGGAVSIAESGVAAGPVVVMVVLIAVLIWCIVGVVKAGVDLRARKRVVDALPPPAPTRPAVAGEIRPEMNRLDGYSDGLRQLVAMIGIVEDDAGVRELRDEILAAADASEARLRRQAMDLTGLLRAKRSAPTEAARQLDATADLLRRRIREGVAGYGELVSAASEAVAASRNLADQTGRPAGELRGGPAQPGTGGSLHPELERPTDQLRALAAGMRELTQG